jgi:hypothetical protein
MLTAVWELKRWFLFTGRTESGADLVCRYGKYLSKVCQALLLNTDVPEAEPGFPSESIYDQVETLKFIGLMIKQGRRQQDLTGRGAFILAQMAQMGRAGPYPSQGMVKDAVKASLEYVSVKPSVLSDGVLARYREGLEAVRNRLRPPGKGVHVSLSGSGSVENPREDGGKGAYMADLARSFHDVDATHELLEELSGLHDCFGEIVFPDAVLQLAVNRIASGNRVKIGDVAYVPVFEFSGINFLEDRVPFGLAKILLHVASGDMLRFGSFDKKPVKTCLGTPLFREKGIAKFVPNISAIPVKASISIESAGKSRLVTSNPAAYTQLGQPLNHFMRQWLSQDPFCRIGFDEGDKLWELLKSYSSYYSKGKFQLDKEKGTTPDFGVDGC